MRPDLVADVGNSRVKWGLCSRPPVRRHASLPPDDPAAWQSQLEAWNLTGPLAWAVSGVHPRRRDALAAWLRGRGDTVLLLEAGHQLPLKVLVEHPDRVGIDRLLNAVAANTRRRPGVAAVVVDAGSAVTVDWVDPAGAFTGGAIFPGLRLMAQALHDHTALLPLVEVRTSALALPGTSTGAAIEAGVFWAVVGGVGALIEQLERQAGVTSDVFLTGGDAPLLESALKQWAVGSGQRAVTGESPLPEIPGDRSQCSLLLWPEMTLEGIRLAAEALS